MAFTYSDGLTTNREKTRFNVGDTQENAGPRPDKRNFSDSELDYMLTDEGSVNGASARAFEILVAEWTPFSISEKEGDVSYDAKNTVDKFRKLADEWRSKVGGGADSLTAGVIALDFQQKDTTSDW